MEDCLYFTLVGSTPDAVANSFIWFLRLKPEFVIKEVFFICSEEDPTRGILGTAKNLSRVIELIHENAEKLQLQMLRDIKFNHEALLIPEANLPEAAKIIAKAVLSQLSRTTILDITAGRKLMSSASVIAGIFLDQFKERQLFFYYYWLLHYTQAKIGKKAYELGIDEIDLILFEVQDIALSLKQVQGD